MDLSIVIVNWNSGTHLRSLLQSLEAVREDLDKIVVVDNASSDSSDAVLAKNTTIECLLLQQNRGFAGAANLGISRTSSEFVLLLNPDIRVEPPALRGLYGETVSRTDAGISCCTLLDPDGGSQEEFQIRPLPTLVSVLKDALFLDELLQYFRRRPTARESGLKARVVEQPAAAFWLLRRETWSSLGGFDESFFPAWYEDVDFCKRLQKTRWVAVLYPRWSAVHHGGLSLEHLDKREFILIYYSNLLKYWRKHHPWSLPLVWLPVRLGVLLRRWLIYR